MCVYTCDCVVCVHYIKYFTHNASVWIFVAGRVRVCCLCNLASSMCLRIMCYCRTHIVLYIHMVCGCSCLRAETALSYTHTYTHRKRIAHVNLISVPGQHVRVSACAYEKGLRDRTMWLPWRPHMRLVYRIAGVRSRVVYLSVTFWPPLQSRRQRPVRPYGAGRSNNRCAHLCDVREKLGGADNTVQRRQCDERRRRHVTCGSNCGMFVSMRFSTMFDSNASCTSSSSVSLNYRANIIDALTNTNTPTHTHASK